MKTLFVFDLDGVLVDSRRNMNVAWNAACVEHGLEVPFSAYFCSIGMPFRDILTSLGIIERQHEIEGTYHRVALQHPELIRAYDGVNDQLRALKASGRKVAIVTSKDQERTQGVLSRFAVEFDYVSCPAERLRGKPAPDQLLCAIAHCNEDPGDSVLIGDMPVDYQCSRRAGVDFIFAKWGYGDVQCEKTAETIHHIW